MDYKMKVGDVVKLRGTKQRYKDTYTIIEIYTNDNNPEDKIANVTFQELHTNTIRTQIIPLACIEKVERASDE